jgi:hypothetical protein
LHTVKAIAELVYWRGGQFVFPVKENRRVLFDAVDGLAWTDSRSRTASSTSDTAGPPVVPSGGPARPQDLPFRMSRQPGWLIERYVDSTAGRTCRLL